MLAPWMKSYDQLRQNITKQRHCFANKVLSIESYVFSSKGQASFGFVTIVTTCSDFGAPPKLNSVTVSIVCPSIHHEVMGPDAVILVF